MSAAKDEMVKIELVGAKTYSTLKKAFKEGEVYVVTAAEWAERRVGLMFQKHPNTGVPMFARSDKDITDIPTERTEMTEHHAADAAALVGLGDGSDVDDDGTFDTGMDQGGGSGNVEEQGGSQDGQDKPSDAPAPSAPVNAAPVPARRIVVGGPRNAALKDALPVPAATPAAAAGDAAVEV